MQSCGKMSLQTSSNQDGIILEGSEEHAKPNMIDALTRKGKFEYKDTITGEKAT